MKRLMTVTSRRVKVESENQACMACSKMRRASGGGIVECLPIPRGSLEQGR